MRMRKEDRAEFETIHLEREARVRELQIRTGMQKKDAELRALEAEKERR